MSMNFTPAPHPVDYGRQWSPAQAFAEWLAWIEVMAPYDYFIYD